MFEDITAEEQRKAVQLIELLENTSDPGKCYLEMRQNVEEKQCAKIAYDSLSRVLMESAYNRFVFKNSICNSEHYTIIKTHNDQCRHRISIKRLGKNSAQQILRKQIFEHFLFFLPNLILQCILILQSTYIVSFDIQKYGINGLFTVDPLYQSHIHQSFLIDTIYLNHPIDIAERLIYRRSSPYSETMLNSFSILLLLFQYLLILLVKNNSMIGKFISILYAIGCIIIAILWTIILVRSSRSLVRRIQDQGGLLKIIKSKKKTSIKQILVNKFLAWRRFR